MSASRREFLEKSATLAALGFLPRRISYEEWLDERAQARRTAPRSVAGKVCVVSSGNGFHTDRPSGIKIAYDRIVNGADTLDAIIAGVNTQELDPEDNSVGLGGLPNEEGVVQLDASCMHGPTKRAGAVGCLEGIATPSLVAKAVMDYTDHIFLVGADAKRFALAMGFREQNLLTESSRQRWLAWKANRAGNDKWISDKARADWLRWNAARAQRSGDPSAGEEAGGALAFTSGTINMNAVNAAGDVSSCTTTSGLSWKIPGRVGDSPIIGAGEYTDNTVGAAGSTGRGESNIMVCGAFLAVEYMRQGLDPQSALIKVMERVIEHTERRLLDDRGRPRFDLSFYALAKDGRYAGATAYEGGRFAVCDEKGPRLEDSAFLFKASERPPRE
ncbi:MAG TPA: N(4)-(beta-N-acetylglucosaminyl)-L-asparaginase [Gemmatimonadaceae bacterium]|nr:N(4)-(beta-N-acetylglucosaminyl)-L-asparaginase [Gemmatimonadaceae bacterium]